MYRPISAYGIVGNMHGVALVADGTIDYCSMPDMDSPTVFAALLDDDKGGHFSVEPVPGGKAESKYIEDTNVLKCTFANDAGKAELTDYMPVLSERALANVICRELVVLEGRMEFRVSFCPRPGYACKDAKLRRTDNRIDVLSKAGNSVLGIESQSEAQISLSDMKAEIRVVLSRGQRMSLRFVCGNTDPDAFDDSCESTVQFWRKWLAKSSAGNEKWHEYGPMLRRSLLALKLLTFEPTGAMVAAATTSLPESIGSGRTWDYRFTWLRDSSFVLKAFYGLDHLPEAVRFEEWLLKVFREHRKEQLRTLYTIRGDLGFPERELDLKGYMSSKPVRVGNSAFGQQQSDIYGEVLDSVWTISAKRDVLDPEYWDFYKSVCQTALEKWSQPDKSIWEFRTAPRHYIYSKLMLWVAVDRAIRIAAKHQFEAPIAEWTKKRDEMRTEILTRGYSTRMGASCRAMIPN